MRALGLDLGGTDVKLALLEGDRVVATQTAPTDSDAGEPEAVLGPFAGAIGAALHGADRATSTRTAGGPRR